MTDQATATPESPPQIERERRPESTAARPEKQPPYAVVLFNDDEHTFQYVIETLNKVFAYPLEKCYTLTEQVHREGRGIVWSGAREVAELKRDQIRSAGPDFHAATKVDFPLGVFVEPLP